MHFERAGAENTKKALEIAFRYAQENGVRHIVVASTTGRTARLLLERFPHGSFNVVVVTHNSGFKARGEQEFPEDLKGELTSSGIKVLTGTMVTRSLGAAVKSLGGHSEQDLVAAALRILGQGVKVCVEIAAMACDAGLTPADDVVAAAGTGQGADTACLIKADSSNRFFQIKVREIIAKPREF